MKNRKEIETDSAIERRDEIIAELKAENALLELKTKFTEMWHNAEQQTMDAWNKEGKKYNGVKNVIFQGNTELRCTDYGFIPGKKQVGFYYNIIVVLTTDIDSIVDIKPEVA